MVAYSCTKISQRMVILFWLLLLSGRIFAEERYKSACNAEDLHLIPGSGRSHGVGNGNPLQYACLETSVDRGAWRAAVHGVAKSWS